MQEEVSPVLLNVKFTRNNVFLNVTDNGQTTIKYSLGSTKTKNTLKRSETAETTTLLKTVVEMYKAGYESVIVQFDGSNKELREELIELLVEGEFIIEEIRDITRIPFNGCRLKKQRRRKK
jgi:small subunit ribosomal protein S11